MENEEPAAAATLPKVELPLRRYSPERALIRPGAFLAEAWTDLKASRELAWRLMLRDIKAQYRMSFFGYVWALLPPIILTLTFVLLRRSAAFSTGEIGMPYVVFALTGTVLWQSFADALNGPLRLVAQSREMLVKINFPREALILSALGQAGFNSLLRLVVLVPVLAYEGVWGGGGVLLFFLGLASLMLLGLGIGVILTPIGALYQDVGYGVTLFIGLWMFATPVLFPVPESGAIATIMRWNPATPILDTARAWLTGTPPTMLTGFIVVALLILVFLFLGWMLYRIALPHLIARLGM